MNENIEINKNNKNNENYRNSNRKTMLEQNNLAILIGFISVKKLLDNSTKNIYVQNIANATKNVANAIKNVSNATKNVSNAIKNVSKQNKQNGIVKSKNGTNNIKARQILIEKKKNFY